MRKKTDNFQLIKFFPDLVFIRLAPGHSWGQELGGLGWGWADASQNTLAGIFVWAAGARSHA